MDFEVEKTKDFEGDFVLEKTKDNAKYFPISVAKGKNGDWTQDIFSCFILLI